MNEKVKITHTLPQQKVTTKDLTKQELLAADNTAAIKITVWIQMVNTFTIGQCYLFQNLSVRRFNNETDLTANLQSTATNIEDIGPIVSSEITEQKSSIQSVRCERRKN